MDYLETARSFAEFFSPSCDLAILAGSFVRNEQTSTSDLDIVIIDDSLTSPYRESFQFSGFLVEAFVHSQRTCLDWMRKDIARRRPSMPQMFLEGVLLKGNVAVFRDMRALAAGLLAASCSWLLKACIFTGIKRRSLPGRKILLINSAAVCLPGIRRGNRRIPSLEFDKWPREGYAACQRRFFFRTSNET